MVKRRESGRTSWRMAEIMIMGKGKRVSQAEEEHVQKWRGRAPPWLRPGGQNKSVSQGPEDEEAGKNRL